MTIRIPHSDGIESVLDHNSRHQLHLRLIGQVTATNDAGELALPSSKKARALLGYLAATRRPQHRDHLCSLLWQDSENPREGLRWLLSRLRTALESCSGVRLTADGEMVALVGKGIYCDWWRLQDITALTPALTPDLDLEQAAEAIDGVFMDGLDLSGSMEFRLWCLGERENLRRQHAAILKELCRRTGFSEQSLPYARRWVLVSPEDEEAHLAFIETLVAVGRLSEAGAHVDSMRQQSERENLPPPYRLIRRWASIRPGKTGVIKPEGLTRHPKIRFCNTRDNVRLAYSVVGEGPRVVKAANWYSHLEHDWESPIWQHLINTLSNGRQLVRYDRRGCGLSDRTTGGLGFDEGVSDLEAVTGLLDSEPFDLVGFCSGAAVSVAYAAKYPHRVRRLILIGSAPVGWRKRSRAERTVSEAMIVLTRQGWGMDNPAYRQVFTSLMFPDATPEQTYWFNELQRVSASPENAAGIMDACGDYDVTRMLSLVKCPTLVIHSRDDAMVSVELGRQCAADIPLAEFVTLPSRNHLILEHEPAWPVFEEHLDRFLTMPSILQDLDGSAIAAAI